MARAPSSLFRTATSAFNKRCVGRPFHSQQQHLQAVALGSSAASNAQQSSIISSDATPSPLWPMTAVGLSLLAASSTAALCEEPAPAETVDATSNRVEDKSDAWHVSLPDEDIDALVTEILSDSSINIPGIPDSIERRIYKSTIQLTIGALYSALSSMDNTPVLAHLIKLRQEKNDDEDNDAITTTPQRKSSLLSASTRYKIDDAILEQVADRLLANQAVNFAMIPDALERQVYINCIKIIFRILTAVSQSFALQICGHELRFTIGPVAGNNSSNDNKRAVSDAITQSVLEQKAIKAASSLSKVDMDLLKEFAAQSGVEDQSPQLGWWDSFFFRKEFMAQLHASLYGLVLGIVDDVLANTKIHILSDELTLDIVPAPEGGTLDDGSRSISQKDEGGRDSIGSFAAASFAAGVGVGVAVMAVLSNGSNQ